jgi:MoxR-like ATPase
MKVATKTTAELEAILGPRGSFVTTKENRWDVRKWLTAQGFKAFHVNRMTFRELSGAYNDVTGKAIAALRAQTPEAQPAMNLPQAIAGTDDNAPFLLVPAEETKAPVIGAQVKSNGAHAPLAGATPGTPDVGRIAEMLAQLFAQQNKPALDFDAVRQIVRDEVQGLKPRPVEVIVNGAAGVVIDERVHPVFDRVLKLVGNGANVMLVGPAGCGKSHLCEQMARALKADYGAIHGTAGASESALTGWLLPSDGGKFEYVPARFVELYEKGSSLFCFDEMDAFDPNMLLVVNGATSNGHIHIAHRRNMPSTKRGKDVRLMATANTFGTGANPMYAGRAALDGATMDRWIIVTVDYDRDLEADIGKAAGLSAAEMGELWTLRDKVRAAQLRRTISTRSFQKAGIMKAAGDNWQTTMTTLTEGWSRDEKAKVGRS